MRAAASTQLGRADLAHRDANEARHLLGSINDPETESLSRDVSVLLAYGDDDASAEVPAPG